jgi:hypothetical protein
MRLISAMLRAGHGCNVSGTFDLQVDVITAWALVPVRHVLSFSAVLFCIKTIHGNFFEIFRHK